MDERESCFGPSSPLGELDLVQFEQFFNDRTRTSAPPAIPGGLLPEAGTVRRMLWARVPIEDVRILYDGDQHDRRAVLVPSDTVSGLFPIHPLQVEYWKDCEIVESGTMQVSASYRTVFYSPDRGGPLVDCISRDEVLMLKLHFEGALPGVPGDRRLSPSKLAKCLAVSGALERLQREGHLARELTVIREEIGMLCQDRGILVRRLPSRRLIPGFSLHSRDRRRPDLDALLVRIVRDQAKYDPGALARDFGVLYARPLAEALLSAFREGFSLEMHPQNFLVRLGQDGGIERVYYRDLEGVVYSRSLRAKQGLRDLFPDDDNLELHQFDQWIGRYFNRNVDHDLSRFWLNCLEALEESGYFSARDVRTATASIRSTMRTAIRTYGLEDLALFGRVFRFAPGPYGPWYRRSRYLRTRFR